MGAYGGSGLIVLATRRSEPARDRSPDSEASHSCLVGKLENEGKRGVTQYEHQGQLTLINDILANMMEAEQRASRDR
jgi:hypothetical protein